MPLCGERVTLPTGHDDTSFDVQILLPAGSRPPYQIIVLRGRSDLQFSQESQETMLRLVGTSTEVLRPDIQEHGRHRAVTSARLE